jgi:hypothetical protein
MPRKNAYVLDDKHHVQSGVWIPGVGQFLPGVPVAADSLQVEAKELDALIEAGNVPIKRTHADVPDPEPTSAPEGTEAPAVAEGGEG